MEVGARAGLLLGLLLGLSKQEEAEAEADAAAAGGRGGGGNAAPLRRRRAGRHTPVRGGAAPGAPRGALLRRRRGRECLRSGGGRGRGRAGWGGRSGRGELRSARRRGGRNKYICKHCRASRSSFLLTSSVRPPPLHCHSHPCLHLYPSLLPAPPALLSCDARAAAAAAAAAGGSQQRAATLTLTPRNMVLCSLRPAAASHRAPGARA